MRAIRAGPSSSSASKVCRPLSARTPTQLTTASAPAIALRVEASSRRFAWIGSTWPTTPYGRTKCASFGRRTATRTRQPARAIRCAT